MTRSTGTAKPNNPAYDVSADWLNAHVTDYVSQSDTIGLGGTWKTGTCSGRSPIVKSHGLGGTPTLVLASINAAQPYPSPCWTADATNITFHHAVTAGCTITFAVRL